MKCQLLFSEKNKKNISKHHLMKFSPRVLSVNKFSEIDVITYDYDNILHSQSFFLFLGQNTSCNKKNKVLGTAL